MRLWVRYTTAVCVIVLTIIWIYVWHVTRTETYQRDWGSDAVFYKPYGNQTRFKGFDYESHIQFPPEVQAEQNSKWQSYSKRRKIKHNINVYLSDFLPLNRDIPDSRPLGCQNVRYAADLPTVSVVIAVHQEWPSVLLRTVHSVINRTPPHLLKEIIVVDDASDSGSYRLEIQHNALKTFSRDLVKIISLPKRQGLVKARMAGLEVVTGQTVSFLDSHMEVNTDWAQPLLEEIAKDRRTIPMSQLDYIHSNSFKYQFREGYRTRYGFDWRLKFFETEYREDQLEGKSEIDPLPGVVMVGAAFIVDVEFFREIGAYDEGMKIWGGENLELSWRVWLCGGRLVHVTCSRVGHIERDQPYDFIEDRDEIEMHNYKRGVALWFGQYSRFVYTLHEGMEKYVAGNLRDRLSMKKHLKCHTFDWFLKNVWPELFVYDENVIFSGGAALIKVSPRLCLDNRMYLFSTPTPLRIGYCTYDVISQNFAITRNKQLRTILQCVTVQREGMDYVPYLRNCLEVRRDTWQHTEGGFLTHINTGLCLTSLGNSLVMDSCKSGNKFQMWTFKYIG